jgi:hypothetical protein
MATTHLVKNPQLSITSATSNSEVAASLTMQYAEDGKKTASFLQPEW